MMIDWDALLPAAPPATPATGAPRPEPAPAPPAADASSGSIAAPWRDGDNRRRCTNCGNLNERGLCLAAHRGRSRRAAAIPQSANYCGAAKDSDRCPMIPTSAPLGTDGERFTATRQPRPPCRQRRLLGANAGKMRRCDTSRERVSRLVPTVSRFIWHNQKLEILAPQRFPRFVPVVPVVPVNF